MTSPLALGRAGPERRIAALGRREEGLRLGSGLGSRAAAEG
jgi:hypothetical protein